MCSVVAHAAVHARTYHNDLPINKEANDASHHSLPIKVRRELFTAAWRHSIFSAPFQPAWYYIVPV